MIEYEDDSQNDFTYIRAHELFGLKDANTFMAELFATASEGEEGATLAQRINDEDVDFDALPAGFEFSEVYSKGGGEGGGDTVVRVYEVIFEALTKVYIKSTGSYYSHDGTYWNDDFKFVQPKQVMVTKYVDF